MTDFLIDTNVISEARKGNRAGGGEAIRYRGDRDQALKLEKWLERLIAEYSSSVLALDGDIAQLWGRLRVPSPRERNR